MGGGQAGGAPARHAARRVRAGDGSCAGKRPEKDSDGPNRSLASVSGWADVSLHLVPSARDVRRDVFHEGRKDEIDALVAEARALHNSLNQGGSGIGNNATTGV